MTPADLALTAALSFEAKKDSMRQTQSGTWKVTFTVQAADVPRSLTEAMPGARYQVVIVEIGDDELPKEVMPDTQRKPSADARPEPKQDKPARAKRDWRDMPPAQQAGIRCEEQAFAAFLRNERAEDWRESGGSIEVITEIDRTAECVRLICGIQSRSLLNTNHAARVIWHQLNDQYEAWMRVGA